MIPAITAILHDLVYKGIDNENTPVEEKKMILSDIRLLRRPLHECVIVIEETLYEEAESYCTYGVTYELSSRIKALLKRGVGTEVLSMKFKPDLKRKLTEISRDLNQSINLNFLKPMTSTSDNNDINIKTNQTNYIKEKEGMRPGIESKTAFSPPQSKRKTPMKSRPDNRLFIIADYVSSTMKRVKNKIVRPSLAHEMNDDFIRLGGFNNYSSAISLINDIDKQAGNDAATDNNNNNSNNSNSSSTNHANDNNNGIDKNQNDNSSKGDSENNNNDKNDNINNDNNVDNADVNNNNTTTTITTTITTTTTAEAATAAAVEEVEERMMTVSASKDSMITFTSPSNFNTAPTSTSSPSSSTSITSNTTKNSPSTDTLQALNSTGDCYSQLTQYRWQEDFIGDKPSKNRKVQFRVLIRDSIPIILRSFLGDDGMSAEKIIQLFGDHIHNLENCLFMQAKSRKEYADTGTLRDRVLDLLKKIDLYLYPNETP
jgi:hypothetical protein